MYHSETNTFCYVWKSKIRITDSCEFIRHMHECQFNCVYLYHIVKINIINVYNIIQISGCSVKSVSNISLLSIRNRDIIKSSHYKTRINWQLGLNRWTCKARDQSDPWFTRQVVYPLQNRGFCVLIDLRPYCKVMTDPWSLFQGSLYLVCFGLTSQSTVTFT